MFIWQTDRGRSWPAKSALHGCVVVLMALISLAGCSLFGEGEAEFRVRTDRSAYPLDAAESIVVTAENRTADVIHFSTCMPAVLEELGTGSAHRTMTLPSCDCFCMARLEPGESWEYQIPLAWILEGSDQLALELDLRYRLRLAFYLDPIMMRPLQTPMLITNSFRLTAAV